MIQEAFYKFLVAIVMSFLLFFMTIIFFAKTIAELGYWELVAVFFLYSIAAGWIATLMFWALRSSIKRDFKKEIKMR